MLPLKGVIVGTSAELTIRLPSRAVVKAPLQKDLRLGDTCYVLYNYTIMKVRQVWTEEEYRSEDFEPQLEWDEPEEPEWVAAHEAAAQSELVPGVSL